MNRAKFPIVIAALGGLAVMLGALKSAQAAGLDLTVNAALQSQPTSACTSNCCPSSVQVEIEVDPESGLWTAQVKGVPVGGNPNNPVPLPVTGNPAFALKERTVIITTIGEDPPTEDAGPWHNVPPDQGGAAGGQTFGNSGRLVDGELLSTSSDTEGRDTDIRVEFELTIRVNCATGGGCATGNCVYVAKWSVTYTDGVATIAPGPY